MLKREIGDIGEDLAVKLLKKKGYKIIARNFLVKTGEIDIIAKKGEYVVFVEVRLRKHGSLVTAAETVDLKKQKRIISAAKVYMLQNDLFSSPVRFDVVAITGENGSYETEIIENAFCGE